MSDESTKPKLRKRKETPGLSLSGTNLQDDLNIRSIPHAPGPEKSVLSLMVTAPENYLGLAITKGVSEEYFYMPAHKTLWKLIRDRYTMHQPVDITSVAQVLTDKRQLDAVGGLAGLADIYTHTTTGAYFDHYLQVLQDKYVLRSIIEASNTASTRAFDGDEEVTSLLDAVEQDVFSIRESITHQEEQDISVLVDQAIDKFDEFLASLRDNTNALTGLSTGYAQLDNLCNGLKPGDMFVIAARPSMGKTAFLLNMLEHIALNQQKPVLMFSCEMPALQIVERLIFSRAQLSRSDFKAARGIPNKTQLENFKKATTEIAKSNLVIDDTAAITISELRAKARRVMRDMQSDGKGGLAAIGVDYLQLLRSYTKQAQNSREREVAEISAGLKALAKELKIPIIVLAQLNRGPENRTGASRGRPQMADLRESGAIEQDADMIGLLFRSLYYALTPEEKSQDDGRASLVIAKNRNGATGDVYLTFKPEIMRFVPREKDAQDEE